MIHIVKAYQRNIESHESTGAITEIAQVVAFIVQVILDNHVSFADARVNGRYHKVIEYFPTLILLLWPYYSAAIALIPFGTYQSASINLQ